MTSFDYKYCIRNISLRWKNYGFLNLRMFSSPLNPFSSPTQQCSSFCEIIYNKNNKPKIQIVRLYCSVGPIRRVLTSSSYTTRSMTSRRRLATSAWGLKKLEDWCVSMEDNQYLVDIGMQAKARKIVSFSGKTHYRKRLVPFTKWPRRGGS